MGSGATTPVSTVYIINYNEAKEKAWCGGLNETAIDSYVGILGPQ